MHEGHRERMRDRIAENGLDSLSDHEFLEYLLYFVQPRVNTNEPAHRLLNTYGSVSAVLESSVEDLVKVEGIGRKSAEFLTTVPKICSRYYLDKYRKFEALSIADVVEYVQVMFVGLREEAAAVLYFDGNRSLILSKIISKGNHREVVLKHKEIVLEAMQKNAPYVVLAHNHPSNNPQPSASDFSHTERLSALLDLAGCSLMDHIIICPNGDYYSFAKERRFR